MILQYFKKKENKYKKIADKVYISILSKSKNLIRRNYFLEINFNSSFELISILFVFYMKILKDNDKLKYDKINNELIKILINDLDTSMREIGIGDMSIGKHVKKYVKKFYYRLKCIDKILNEYDEKNFIEYLDSIISVNKQNTKNMAVELKNIYDELKKNKEIV